MIESLRSLLGADPRIAYALLFGSQAKGTAGARSDLDVAIGVARGHRLGALDIGQLIARIESASGVAADVVLLDDAPPGLAYRIFRDGRPIVIRDEKAFKNRLARAVLDYLDFRPIEEVFTQGVLRARHGR